MILISASSFKWINGVGTAKASEVFNNRTPSAFNMVSSKTNKVKTFTYSLEEAIENESWDGELQKFKTDCGLVAIVWNC